MLTAISLTAVRLVLKGVDSYKSNLETRIGIMVGTPVKLGSLGANMRGVSPELVLKDVNIASTLATAPPTIHLKEIRLGINLGDFLLSRDALASSWITLVGAKLSIIRKQDGQFVIEGLKADGGEPLWLLQGRQYEVLQSQITWQDKQQGGEPLVLEAVNLAIMNDGKDHRVHMMTNLPEKYGDDIKMILAFEGEPEKLAEIKGDVFFVGNKIKLHELISTYLPSGIIMTAGSVDIKAWGRWEEAKLASLNANARIRQGVFARKGKGTFPVNYLETNFSWQNKGQQWLANIDRFLLETPDNNRKSSIKWPDAIVSLSGQNATGSGSRKLALYAKQLDLTEAAKLAQFFAPLTEEQDQILGQAQANGLLRDFSVYIEPETKNFAVAGRFDSVGLEPLSSMPGIENLSGQVKGDNLMGAVEISAQGINFKAPRLFDKPLPLDKLKGVLRWRQTENQWALSSQSIMLDCPAFESESRILVNIPKNNDSPFLDLQTSLKSDDMGRIRAYLPTKVLNNKVKQWLEPAFVAGMITKGDVLFYGKVSDLPFTNGTGVLEAFADVDQLELNFNPEWPHISGINGRISYEHNDIIGSFNSGKIGKADIIKTDALIPSLGSNDERLFIKGEARGNIGEVLNVLQQSPLVDRVSPVTKATSTQGEAKVAVDLTIPFWAGQALKADGNVQMKNTQLTVKQLDLKVDKINGTLKFNKDGIYGNTIKAIALRNPIEVNIAQANRQTLINVDGKASAKDIENLFGWTEPQIAEGEAPYQFQLQLPTSETNEPIMVNVKSNLEGVALQLPDDLAKSKNQRKPTSVTVDLSDELALPITIDYNNELKAALKLSPKGQKINSGHVLIGNGSAEYATAPGIKLEINRERLDLQDWLGLAAAQQTNMPKIDVNEIKLHSQTAFFNKTRLGPFDLSLKHKPNSWAGEIDSAIAKGRVQIPVETEGDNPVFLDMDMLSLTALKQLGSQESSGKAEFKTLLNIKSKKTLWKTKDLGQLALVTQRTPDGMDINKLELAGEDGKLMAKGNWREAGSKSTTNLNGKLELKKADQFFDKLDITKDFTDTSGAIDFKLNWNSTPWQPSLSDLGGTMDVKLKNGRILSIEPGFGRVLGILAVAQWIKRLQLDFGDIYEEGLTFNSIEGHFDLLKGKATTKDLLIDAVPAKITITGDTDLINQTVDHVIKVVPKSLDAVPIAGTIVSRIAAMVGKTLTGKDQEGFFFGTQYLVKGKWDDVKISSQHENDGLFQKTWNSITDFPWQGQKKQ